MKRCWVLVAVALAGCPEPPKTPPSVEFQDHLRDIYQWDPQLQAKGHYAYDSMFAGMAMDPKATLYVLFSRIGDPTPTAINDNLHDPVPVGDVVFHILMKIFEMSPDAFENEGVWVMTSDPSKNPIYMVKFKDADSRFKVVKKLEIEAKKRGWLEQK